ncbi:RNA-directed DNA polymerase, eukaryota [Artemisia annua]|uniref:RNA-directed DNA polymerase, eukaryota n=1 Tax=Artemisia annua TaxID=35608 RepID=A0A2U1NMC6_ARTAN|nr:RNA-directed DNA polymerase, eukaryota [Artemisia annua]
MSLLGKWKWRFLLEPHALWNKFIKELHGHDGGFRSDLGSASCSGVWENIIRCCNEMEKLDLNLNNLMVKKVNSGNQTRFWTDSWISGTEVLLALDKKSLSKKNLAWNNWILNPWDIKQITDVRFEGMSFDHLFDLVTHLVHNPLKRLYYCKVGTPLRLGIKEIKNDDDVEAFLIVGYETKWVVDMYVEHLDDDAFDVRDFAETNNVDLGNESSDAYRSSDEEDYGFIDEQVNEPAIEVINDPDNIDPKYRAKAGIIYSRHDPTQQWDKMEPILGMRFETNEQLKLALANYGVANGYQLWFMRNDWKQLLVYCGRDVQSVVVGCSNDGEGSSKSPNKVIKKGRIKRKSVRGVGKDKNVCGFRLFASWMSTEMSFPIKSLKPKHRCSRNYNLAKQRALFDDEESCEQETYNRDVASVNAVFDTQESVAGPKVADVPSEANKGKSQAITKPNKRGTKRQAHDDPLRIYHKNRGISERIFDQKMKKPCFGADGEGSTPESTLSVDEP